MYANNFNLSSYTFYALQLPSTNKDHLSPLSPSLSLDPSLSLRCRGTASSRRSHETSSRRSSRESPPTLRPRSATSPTCEDRKFDFDFNFNFNFYSIFLYSACLCMYMTLTRDLYPTFHARTYVRMHACMNVRTYVDIYIYQWCVRVCAYVFRCKVLYEMSKSREVGRRMAVEREGMLSWWDREKFLDLIRSCAKSGNLEACFVLGLVIYVKFIFAQSIAIA